MVWFTLFQWAIFIGVFCSLIYAIVSFISPAQPAQPDMADTGSSSSPPAARDSETTPLLAPEARPNDETTAVADGGEGGASDDALPITGPPPADSWIHIATIWSLGATVLTYPLAVTVWFLEALSPPGYSLETDVRECSVLATVLGLVAILFDSLNLHRNRHGLQPPATSINIFIDLVLSVCYFALSTNTIWARYSPDFYGGRCSRNYADCEPYRFKVAVVLWAFWTASAVVCISHLVLLARRCLKAYRDGGVSRRMARWSVPTGQITFEFTIKFLRQEGPTSSSTARTS